MPPMAPEERPCDAAEDAEPVLVLAASAWADVIDELRLFVDAEVGTEEEDGVLEPLDVGVGDTEGDELDSVGSGDAVVDVAEGSLPVPIGGRTVEALGVATGPLTAEMAAPAERVAAGRWGGILREF